MKLIEIIGEAARAVAEPTKMAHPEIPWKAIVGMRNHLIHRYFKMDLVKVWEVVQDHIPALVLHLQKIVPPPG